jgi:hypothetical protein
MQMKVEEEKSLAQEAEQQRRCETPDTWERYFTKQEEVNECAREAGAGGTTFETWLPLGYFPSCYFQNLTNYCNSCLKGLTSAFVIFFLL